ncbi:MAG: acyltransferase domain-containing protein, partial [Chloroflexi bacterium]|nr:acyltransferase domain-containing protein [Chloroflexota bacterium]
IEAHGTGTPLGDPIEVGALGKVFAERSDPLYVGSVKTNIGHLEFAAGVAGVMKLVMVLQQGLIPPHLHLQQPNPHIDWASLPVRVPTAATPWAPNAARRIGGVSSFGFSGTNAHVVVEEAPAPEAAITAAERPLHLLTLSARDDAALAAYARSYSDFLEAHPELDLGDLTYTGHVGRSHFSHRLSMVAGSVAELREKLVAASRGEQETQRGVVAAQQEAPRIAFLFTGQGSQYAGMGRELYETEPMFRESIDRCAALLDRQLATPLLELLGYTGEAAQQHIDRTENTQPALFVLEYALAQRWRSWGIEPTALLGHSVGELAAACVAGVFSLEDGLTLVAARGRLMGALPQEGEMVSLLAAESRVREAIAPYADELSIAAVNGPASVVISGSRDAVLAVSEFLAAEGVKSQRLTVSHAFHSPLMEPMLEAFRQVAEQVTYHKPVLQLVSNVTGQLAGDEIATPGYWVRHVREAVRFADGVAVLHSQGVQIFLEIGPKPVLLSMAGGDSGQWSVASGQWSVASGQWGTGGRGQEAERIALLPSLRPGQGEWQQLLASLGALYVRGAAIDWEGFDRGYTRRKLALPTYPFQRQRYWVQSRPAGRAPAPLHPLIDKVTPLPQQQLTLYEREFSVESLPFLAEHRVYGELVSPGACQIAMALSAAALHFGEQLSLTDLVLPSALVLAEGKPRTVQLFFEQQPGAVQRPFTLVSFASAQTDNEVELRTHASGRVAPLQALPVQMQLAALQQLCTEPVDLAALDARLAAAQLDLGPTFRWIAQGWSAPAQAVPQLLARLARPSVVEEGEGHLLHPGLLDACFQAASLAAAPEAGGLPFALAELQLCRRPAGDSWWCHVVQRSGQGGSSTPLWEIQLFDEQGLLVLAASGFQMRAASAEAIAGESLRREWLHTLEWRPAPLSAASVPEPDCWLWVGAAPEQPAGWTAPSYRLDSTADAQALQRQVSEIAARHASVGVVFQPAAAPEESSAPQQALQACTALLTLSQALLATSLELRLWVVTAGAQTVAGQAASKPEGTAVGGSLWGLGRTLALEEPRLRCVLVDLEPGVALQTDLLARELRAAPEAGGTERAWRAGVRYQAHLVRSPAEPTVTDLDHPVRLQLSEYGSLDALHFVPAVRRQPGPGEVEV